MGTFPGAEAETRDAIVTRCDKARGHSHMLVTLTRAHPFMAGRWFDSGTELAFFPQRRN